MTLFGHQIDIQLLLQLVTTATVIWVYALITSRHEQESDHRSDCQMVLLVSFLFNNHATVKTLKTLTEAPEDILNKKGETLHNFASRLNRFCADGALPEFTTAAKSGVWNSLWLTVLAPLAAIALVALVLEEGRHRGARVRNTDSRKTFFTIAILELAANVLITVVATAWALGHEIIIVGIVGITASTVAMSLVVAQQAAWKRYWSGRLLEVMAAAERERNHDLFNRAMLLSGHVDSQPDVPVPGRLGYYSAIYSGVQALIIFLVKVLKVS